MFVNYKDKKTGELNYFDFHSTKEEAKQYMVRGDEWLDGDFIVPQLPPYEEEKILRTFLIGREIQYSLEEAMPEPKEPENHQIYDNQLLLMEAMATQYEEQQAADISSMEVQATIYEAVLGIKEGGIENGRTVFYTRN